MSDVRSFAGGSPGGGGGGGGSSAGVLTTVGTKTAAYTAGKNQLVPVDATGGAVPITLPTAAAAGVGGVVVVRKTDSSANPVSVARSGSDTINESATSATLSLPLEVLTFTSDGTSKWTISAGQKSLSSLDARYSKRGEVTLSVLDYGTPGSDDLAMVQAAVNASASTGLWVMITGDRPVAGTVTVPSGAKIDCSQGRLLQQSNLTPTLKINNAVSVRIRSPRIVGKGTDYANNSSVYATAGIWIAGTSSDVVIEGGSITGCTGAGIHTSDTVSDFHIRNVKLVGPGAPPVVGTTSNFGGGIVIDGNDNFSVVGCDISQYAQGIVSGLVNSFRITGNRIHDIVGQHGLYLEPGAAFTIADNLIFNTVLQGIKLQIGTTSWPDVELGTVSDNVVRNAGSHGIILTNPVGGTPRLRRLVVANNTISGDGSGAGDGINANNLSGVQLLGNSIYNVRAGVAVSSSDRVRILDNLIDACTQQGVLLTDVSDSRVSRNSIKNPGSANGATTEFGIQVTGTTTATIVVDNNRVNDALGNMRYALYAAMTAGQSYLVVRNNELTGATDYAARFTSTDGLAEWSNNIVAGTLGATLNFPTSPVRGTAQVNVLDYGVKGDGTTDDTAALTAAVAAASGSSKKTLYIPADLNVKITAQVNAQFVRRIDCQGTITVAYTGGPGLIIGDSSAQANGCWYYFKRVAWAGVQTNVALQVLGLKGGRVTVEYCDYLQLWADNGNAATSSMSYNEFFLGRAVKLELNGADVNSWINENNFYGGRIDNLIIQGAYPHNNNTWHGCSVEGTTSTIQILTGSCNRVDCRGEGVPGPSVTFGAGTWANQVVGHYVSASGVHATPLVLVSDGGVENILTSALDEKMNHVELVKIDKSAALFDASSSWQATSPPIPGLDKLAVRTVNGQVLDTGIVPIRGTYALDGGIGYYRNWSMLRFNVDSDTTLWRPQVYAYDSTGAQIDPSVTPFMQTTGGWTISAGGYTFGANVQFAQIILTSATVASIRIVVTSPSAVGTAFGYLRLLGYVPTPMPDTAAEQFKRSMSRSMFQASAPTQGLARPGRQVGSPTGQYTCVGRADTTLTAQGAAAATSLTVASIAGISSGDVIGVLLDTGLTHWTTVSAAPSGSTVTLTAGLPSVAASGRAVGTTTWLALGTVMPTVKASGLTGATAASRYVGGTTSGAPTSGTFLTGDWVTSADGRVYVCTAGGTPGTWTISTGINVQDWSSSGTWVNPSPTIPRLVRVFGQTAGSGGGAGRRGAAATIRGGGGGGAPGVPFETWMLTTDLPATVPATIGAGGLGASAVTTDDTDGAAGGNGGATSFGAAVTTYRAGQTNSSTGGGRGGTTGVAAGGGSNAGGGTGGAASATGTVGGNASTVNLTNGGILNGGTGGGAGGGITAAESTSAGGAGGTVAGYLGGGAGGASTGAAGGAPPANPAPGSGGLGGGGGCGGNTIGTVAGGAGAAGGFPGGGGGGGGGSTNGAASGAGGAGAGGWLRVVTFMDVAGQSSPPQTTRFLASGTFTVPAGCTRIELSGISASAGAGSGARAPAASVPCGGASGAPGARLVASFPATGGLAPGQAVSVTIGSPGVGGAAQTVDGTAGNAGTIPGNTSFGSFAQTIWSGAAPTGGGLATAGTAVGSSFATFHGGSGQSSSAAGAAGAAGGGLTTAGVPGSGGAGGGISSGGTAGAGGGGNIVGGRPSANRGNSGVVGGATPTSAAAVLDNLGASGSGGGAASVTAAAQAGADGTFPGGGPGGGGASLNTFASGAGGNGAAGYLDVTAHFGD